MKFIHKNHLFLQSAAHIDAILTPLKKLGIIHFSYMNNFNNGAQIYLSNNALWIEDYYNLELYKSSAFELNPNSYNDKWALWSPLKNSPVITLGIERFNSDHGITLMQKHSDGCEFFFFSSTPNNPKIINFYINNIDVLENFIVYFKQQAASLLQKLSSKKILFTKKYNLPQKNIEIINCFSQKELYDLKSNLINPNSADHTKPSEKTNLIVNGKIIHLTKRQIQCLQHLLQGKSAKQTAQLLNLSTRTIESYLDLLKVKLQCRTKIALLSKLVAHSDLLFS